LHGEMTSVSDLWRDIRFGLRLLVKSPSFAAVAILALALGIGANTAIFSVVYGTFLEPLPFPHPEQLVMVWSKINGERNSVAAADYLEWKKESTSFQELSVFTWAQFNISTNNQPEYVLGWQVPAGFTTRAMGIGPALGRDFLPEEEQLGKNHVVILTHKLWERRFGGDARIIGQPIRVNGESYTVVGVLPAGVNDRYDRQVLVPLALKPEQINHDFHWLVPVGRLKPGVSLAQAQSEMAGVTKRIAEAYPKSNRSWGAKIEPFQNDFLNRDIHTEFWLLLGAVGLVLLIACANVANLLLVRGMSRQKEVAIRASLGATQGKLFAQFLAESLVLAAIGGVAGVGLGWVILRTLLASLPPLALPPEADVRISLPVLAFTLAITTVCGLFCGCVPAWQAARLNLNGALKEGGRATASSGHHRLGRAFVIAQCALTLTLLASAGLLIHSFWNLGRVDLGVRTDHVLTFLLPVPADRFSQPEQMVAFYRQFLAGVEALPGVSEAAVSTGRPVQDTGFGMPFSIAGKPVADLSSRPDSGFQMVTPGFYKTFGIRLISGRTLTDQDVAGSLPVAMVNETFVKRFLAGVDPLTQRVSVEKIIPGVTQLGAPIEWQIVGVFHNIRYGGVGNQQDYPEIEVPFWQSPWPFDDVAVRTAGDPAAMTKAIAAVVHSLDADLPLAEVKTMDQVVAQSVQGTRVVLGLLICFAATALLLAAIGIYGVMAFSVAQRTHEIGMRMALGADSPQVLRMILRDGMILTLVGLVLGAAGAFVSQRLMRSQLHGIGAIDPGSFGAVLVLLVIVALLACYVPARRATRLDPLECLREE
jgi:putative ABC transport system permease protein